MAENRMRPYLIMIIFICIIFFPVINSRFDLVKDIKSSENRQMSSKPEMIYSHLDIFPEQYEKYYNDNFTIRSFLVKCYNLLNIELFKKSPVPNKVVIGKDKWLFMAGDELDSYAGKNRFEQSELEEFKQELEYRKKYLEQRDCKFYFVVAPVKANIYSEKMPDEVFRFSEQCWGEQLLEFLNENSNVKPIDIYPTLRKNKDKELLYFMIDNHWNQLGAYYSACEILKRIQIDFPEIEIPSLEDYNISKTEKNIGNIQQMLSNINIYRDYSFELKPKKGFQAVDVPPAGYPVVKGFAYPKDYEKDKEIKGSTKPKILIITDSYGVNIFPFLAENFSRSVKIFDAWQYKLNEDIVNSEKSDVVLVIVLESNLRSMLKNKSSLNSDQGSRP
jgi:hypothetical protein